MRRQNGGNWHNRRLRRDSGSGADAVSFRRRGTVIAASIVIALVAGAIPFQIVRNRLAPPVTAGLSPERLATLFYESWAMLDHETMDDALAKGVAAGILREVTNLYVVDRVQFAHSMEDRVIPAAEWIARGQTGEQDPLRTDHRVHVGHRAGSRFSGNHRGLYDVET